MGELMSKPNYTDKDADKYDKNGVLWRDQYRKLETDYAYSQMILEAIEKALDGDHESISDFEQSFGIVRKAMDMWVEVGEKPHFTDED